MAINWARGGLFAGGILVGAVLAGALFTQGRDERGDTAAAPPAAALQQTAVVNNSRRIDCSFAPIVTPAGKEDGLLPLDKDLQGNSPSAVATLILSGKEAAAAGRPRDAETAFLMACRSGEEVKNDPIPLADAQYQLGRHYAQVAAPPDVPKRQELLKRAEALYASSLQVYLKHRGASHEKTRFAQEGLDALQRLTAPAPIVAAPNAEERRMAEATKVVGNAPQSTPAASPAPVTPAPTIARPAPAAVAEPAPAAEVAKAPEPRPARRTQPSFDCGKAGSTTEKLICADEDLARQDRELGRLHARAKQAAADPRAFQRESDAEWQAREQTCTDRECLQRWYAKRRAELGAAAQRNERERAPRAERTERAPAPAPATAPTARSAPEPTPVPAPRAAAPSRAPALEPAAPTVQAEPPPPRPRAEAPEPAPRVVVPAPVVREPEFVPPPPPPAASLGGPPATAAGGTDVPTE